MDPRIFNEIFTVFNSVSVNGPNVLLQPKFATELKYLHQTLARVKASARGPHDAAMIATAEETLTVLEEAQTLELDEAAFDRHRTSPVQAAEQLVAIYVRLFNTMSNFLHDLIEAHGRDALMEKKHHQTNISLVKRLITEFEEKPNLQPFLAHLNQIHLTIASDTDVRTRQQEIVQERGEIDKLRKLDMQHQRSVHTPLEELAFILAALTLLCQIVASQIEHCHTPLDDRSLPTHRPVELTMDQVAARINQALETLRLPVSRLVTNAGTAF